jgi:predicted MFS family arabinose efflux permease
MVRESPFLISCVLFFGGFFVSAFQLLPALVMNSIQGSGEGFGAQKMYLSAAWALTSFVVGHLIDAFGLRAMFVVHIAALLAFFCAVCSMAEARLGEKDGKAGQQSIGSLIQRPEVALLGMHLAVHAILLALINSFLGVYILSVLEAPKSALGTAACINAISEFPMFFLADKLIAKIGPENSLTVSTLSLALRLGVIGVLPLTPWTLSVVLGLNLLHGLNLAVFQCAATTAADNLAPGNPVIHAINGTLTQILGNACGSVLWGKVWGHFGAQRTFLKAAECALSWIVSWNALGSFIKWRAPQQFTVGMHTGKERLLCGHQ